MRVMLLVPLIAASHAWADSPPDSVEDARISLFVACDNLLRCVREPCPSTDVVLLPSGERLARTTPDIGGLSRADRDRLDAADGLYNASIILEGRIGNGTVLAQRVVRTATDAEAALCRER